MTEQDEFVENELRIRCSDAVELVTEYLDNALSQRDLDDFERHVAQCEGCAVFLDQIKMTITLTSATSRQQVEVMPANFHEVASMLAERANRQD